MLRYNYCLIQFSATDIKNWNDFCFTTQHHFILSPNMYVDHPNGNYGLYGLNTFGGDSIISYKGNIWKFHAYVTGDSKHAIYVNVDGSGEEVVIDLYDKTLKITRMLFINTANF